jgi:LmbE family N-acetylglucosaminyl deacetylase
MLSPHADDETLFAAFTIVRHRPYVAICFPSQRDYGSTLSRYFESRQAVEILGGEGVEQWEMGLVTLEQQMRILDHAKCPEVVWAPHLQSSHREHQAVAAAAAEVFGARVRTYHTYDVDGKVRAGVPVPFEPAWIEKKLKALACYKTQIAHPRASMFFTWDLLEYCGGEA